MIRYFSSRVAQAALVLWGAFTVAFGILYMLPGDPLTVMLASAGIEADSLTPAQLAQARVHYGLDHGMLERYFTLLGGFLRGDFGVSLMKNEPIGQLILDRLPATLSLSALAIALSVVLGFGFAYLATLPRGRPLRRALNRLPSLGFSIPVFWVGLLLIQLFAFDLGWFPPTGNDGIESLILPAVALSVHSAAVYAQVLIRSFDDVWKEPYIVTALAKGLTRGQVQARHALRNAVLPALTLVGLELGNTVSNAVVVETVFARTGIGRLAHDSVLRQDIPTVLAVVVLSAAVFVGVNLFVDLLYSALDPRIVHTPKVT